MRTRDVAFGLVGLGMGMLTGAAFVGRAMAQQPQSPPAPQYGPRWQYKCITGLPQQMFKPDSTAALNREGAEGWRLLDGLSAHNHLSGGDQYCFIRQY